MPATNSARHVVATVDMRLMAANGGSAEVSTEFRYSTKDPFAVQATFSRPAHTPVVWVFARDLLLAGASRHAGAGDVQIYPSGDAIVFDLNSPEGSARLVASATAIRSFVSRVVSLVGPGEEQHFVDIDAELESLSRSIFAGGEA